MADVPTSKVAENALSVKFSDFTLQTLPAVGPAAEKVLNEKGVFTFWQILVQFGLLGEEAFLVWFKGLLKDSSVHPNQANIDNLVVVLRSKLANLKASLADNLFLLKDGTVNSAGLGDIQ